MRVLGRDNHYYEESRRSSNISVIEAESSYTPRHNYNTRLSVKLSQNSQLHARNPFVDLTQSTFQALDHTPQGSDILEPFDYPTINVHPDKEVYQEGCLSRLRKFSLINMGCPDFRQSRSSRYSCSTLCIIGAIVALFAMEFVPTYRLLVDIKTDVNETINEVTRYTARLEDIEKILTNIKKKQDQEQDKAEEIPDSCQHIQQIIKEELNKMETKKSERPDFALATAGAKIVKLVDTENLEPSKMGLFGGTCEALHGPHAILAPENAPGQCWAFKGNRGAVIVKLLGPVRIDGVTLHHISKAESPTGRISSAPKDFLIQGLMDCDASKGQLLGQFTYDIDGPQTQSFEIAKSDYPFECIEFTVLSNHGHPDFTCIYRLKIHGIFDAPVP